MIQLWQTITFTQHRYPVNLNYMRKNIRTLLLAFTLLSLVSSCKKNSDKTEEGYYLKFKVDGNWVTWTNALSELGKDLDDDTKTNFSVQGTSADMKESFGISFQVDGTSINTGTYSSNDYFMPVDYTITNGSSTTWYSDKDGSEPYSVYSVTLNNITETAIKGSFTGNFLADDSVEENTIAITEGEFYLKRIR